MGDWDIGQFKNWAPFVQKFVPPKPAPLPIEPAAPKPNDTSTLSITSSVRLGGYAPSPRSEAPSAPKSKLSTDELKAQTTSKSITGGSVKNMNTSEGRLADLKNQRLEAVSISGMCPLPEGNTELAADQNDVFGALQNEEQKAAFKEMTVPERKNFVAISRAVGANDAANPEAGQKATQALQVLLESRGLDDVDDRGRTVLETLGEAASKNLAPELKGVDKKEALQSLVSELAFTNIYQGEGTDTCASATMQSLMAASMPGEYARIATDLLFEGETTLQFGAQMKVSTNELPELKLLPTVLSKLLPDVPKDAPDGRNDFDKIMQGSFAAFARTFPGTGEEFGGRGGSGGSSRGGDNSSGTGLYNNQVKEMYYHITGNDAAVAKVTEENRDVLFADMISAMQDGLYLPVGIDADGEKNNYGHAVTVVGMGVQGVTYVDSLDMKKKTMPVSEFKEKMSLDGMVVLPKEYAHGIDIVEKPESHPAVEFFANLADRFLGAFGCRKLFDTAEEEGSSGGRGGRGGSAR
ncbi:MAG TPA: hypothetical protein DD435_05175 [Cyanobacteria bacterium UBA8530]|nr:hypothetical protein [Cyanobacteria bacterium UBA8530]